ncbi:MAG TPA: hypothetical protein VJY39_19765 [Acidisphaera sp.]|nr:hypothetical protein [Acidisphaera sp.]
MSIGVWNLRWAGVLPPAARQRSLRMEPAAFMLERYRGPVVHGRAYAMGTFAVGLPRILSAPGHDRIKLSVDPLEAEPDPPSPKPRIEPRIARTSAPPHAPAAEQPRVRLRLVHASIASAEGAVAGIDLARFADGEADTAAAWLALSGYAARGPFGVRRLAA